MATKDVNLNPKSFAEDGGLLDLSMEEVVGLLLLSEKRRYKNHKDDENQEVTTISCREVPTGLMLALDASADYTGTTRALLTRCLSHQIAAWVDSINRIGELVGLFNAVRDAAVEFGYPDLYDGMKPPHYTFASSVSRKVSLTTIQWVKNKLVAVSGATGITQSTLFAIGLCYSLSKSSDIRIRGTADKFFKPEVARFAEHMEEQSLRICTFNDMVRRRAKADGLEDIDGARKR